MSDRAARLAPAVLAAAASLWILRTMSAVLLPFAAAFFLALVCAPALTWLERRGWPSGAAALLILSLLAGAVGGLGFLVWLGMDRVAADVSRDAERLSAFWRKTTATLGIQEQAGTLGRRAATTFAELAQGAAAGLLNLLSQGLLVFFVLLFALLMRRRLPAGLRKAFGEERGRDAEATLVEIEHRSLRFLWLRTIVSAVTAAGAWAILALFGVNSAFLWAGLLFAAQYVPYVGPIVATIPPVLMAFLQFPSASRAAWTAAALVLWGVLVGYLVEPKVMGRGLTLNEVAVLFSITCFGWLWGGVGILLATPLLVIVRVLAQKRDGLKPLQVFLGPLPS